MMINTIYHLYYIKLNQSSILKKAEHFLMIPEYLNYLLTGQRTITTLSNEEVQVINMYREADVQAKKDVLGVLFATGRATVGGVDNHQNTISGQQIGNNNEQTNNFDSTQNSTVNVKKMRKGKVVGIKNN